MNTAATAARPASSRTVSRQLAAAGYDRSQSSSTAVRGYSRSTRGFRAQQWLGGPEVRVDHYLGSARSVQGDPEEQARMQATYTATLTALGYTVRLGDTSNYLLVTR